MAYSGSTALSSVANPPVACLGPSPQPTFNAAGNVVGSSLQTTTQLVGGNQIWKYMSSDPSTAAQAPGYFTDGLQLGMRIGDIIFVVAQTSLGTSPTMNVGVIVTTNSTAGFNVASAGAIASS